MSETPTPPASLTEALDTVILMARDRLSTAEHEINPPLLHLFTQDGACLILVVMAALRKEIPPLVRLHVAAHDPVYAVLTLEARAVMMNPQEQQDRATLQKIRDNRQFHSYPEAARVPLPSGMGVNGRLLSSSSCASSSGIMKMRAVLATGSNPVMHLDRRISWRLHPRNPGVRKTCWELFWCMRSAWLTR